MHKNIFYSRQRRTHTQHRDTQIHSPLAHTRTHRRRRGPAFGVLVYLCVIVRRQLRCSTNKSNNHNNTTAGRQVDYYYFFWPKTKNQTKTQRIYKNTRLAKIITKSNIVAGVVFVLIKFTFVNEMRKKAKRKITFNKC